MGSLIYRMEHGVKPKLSVDETGALVLPEVQIGHEGLDAAIRKVWLGQYSSTTEMLMHIESFLDNENGSVCWPNSDQPSRESLRDRVRQWRERPREAVRLVVSWVAMSLMVRLCPLWCSNRAPDTENRR